METFMQDYAVYLGIFSAVVILAERIAKITPTETDDKIVAYIHKIASVIGLNFKDNPGDK